MRSRRLPCYGASQSLFAAAVSRLGTTVVSRAEAGNLKIGEGLRFRNVIIDSDHLQRCDRNFDGRSRCVGGLSPTFSVAHQFRAGPAHNLTVKAARQQGRKIKREHGRALAGARRPF